MRLGVENSDELFRVRKRKRPEKNGIDHREDREVRPETDRDRGQRGHSERRSFAQLAKRKAKVVHENFIRRATLRQDLPWWPAVPVRARK